VIDYSVPGEEAVLGWDDLATVTASSSASDAYASLRLGPGHGPQQALDEDPRTRWVSGRIGEAVGEWLQLDFTAPTRLVGTTIELSAASPLGARPQSVMVETDKGKVATEAFAGPAMRLRTPPGDASWLRITLTEAEDGTQNGFSIAEVSIPGVRPGPTVALPGQHAPDLVILEEGKRGRSDCLTLDGVVACSPTLGLAAEDLGWRRSWTASAGGEYSVRGEVRAIDGAGMEELLALPGGWKATASSRLVSAPAGRPDAGIDADPATGWVASPEDPRPWYEVSFPRRSPVTGLKITKSFSLPASTPVTVIVRYDDGTRRTATADANGRITLPSKRTTSLHLTFGDVRLMENIDSETGVHSFAPIGFSELQVLGPSGQPTRLSPEAATGVPCGFGPEVVVSGKRHSTRVRGTVGDLLTGRALDWELCRDGGLVSTSAGQVNVGVRATAEFAPSTLSMRSVSSSAPQSTAVMDVSVDRISSSVLNVAAEARQTDSVLVLPQNFNTGWTASTGEGPLEPIRVNGWQQGFVLPAGGQVALVAEFAPNRIYQFGLYIGALFVLLVLFAALRPSRYRSAGRPAAWSKSPFPGSVVAVTAGGPPALVAGVVAMVIAGRWSRAWWAAPIALMTAGGVVVAMPFPEHLTRFDSVAVQTLVWSSILVLLWSGPEGRRILTRLMSGRSRNR
jgi:arabinofuranan 3-O-arabinosyltransferase